MLNRLSATQAILYGTLVVGTLDALDAIVFFWIRSGARPIRIFQGIASGLLGPAARQAACKPRPLASDCISSSPSGLS